MAKKKIINVYLSFPFVGRTKKNIEATMNYMKHEAEKYLRGLIGMPKNAEFRYFSLYDVVAVDPIVYVGNEKHTVPNAYKKLHGKTRSIYIITSIAYKLADCKYFIRVDPKVSNYALYTLSEVKKLKKLYVQADSMFDLELEAWKLYNGINNRYKIPFLNSSAAINAFPELKKMNRQELIKLIRM